MFPKQARRGPEQRHGEGGADSPWLAQGPSPPDSCPCPCRPGTLSVPVSPTHTCTHACTRAHTQGSEGHRQTVQARSAKDPAFPQRAPSSTPQSKTREPALGPQRQEPLRSQSSEAAPLSPRRPAPVSLPRAERTGEVAEPESSSTHGPQGRHPARTSHLLLPEAGQPCSLGVGAKPQETQP